MGKANPSPSQDPNHEIREETTFTSSGLNSGVEDFPRLGVASAIGSTGQRNSNPSSSNLKSKEAPWLSLFDSPKPSSKDAPMVFDPPSVVDGKKLDVVLSSQDFTKTIIRCENLVVGFFVGRKLSFSAVQASTTKLWQLKSEVCITVHGSTYVFEFKNNEDRKSVLELGSFYIAKSLFIIRPWSPLIEKNISEMKTIPIWALIYGVPLHFWDNLGLSKISSYLGKPVMADEHTLNRTRLTYARVCIEIEPDFSYPTSIPILIDGSTRMELPVEYHWKPPFCDSCATFGHSSSNCPKKVLKTKTKWVPKKTPIADPISEAIPSTEIVNHVASFTIPDPIINEETGTQGTADFMNVASDKEGVVPQQQAGSVPLEVNGAGSSLTNGVGGEVSDLQVQPSSEKWTSYTRKKKKNSVIKGDAQKKAIGYINPFDVLFSEDELVSAGFSENSASHGVEDLRGEENVVDAVVGSCVDPPLAEELGEDNVVEIPQDFFEDTSPTSEDLFVRKEKSLDEIPRRIPMTKAQNVDKLLKFIGSVEAPNECPEEDKKSLMNFIADKHQKSRKERELESLGFKGDPSNNKLGRGLRNSAKKKS